MIGNEVTIVWLGVFREVMDYLPLVQAEDLIAGLEDWVAIYETLCPPCSTANHASKAIMLLRQLCSDKAIKPTHYKFAIPVLNISRKRRM